MNNSPTPSLGYNELESIHFPPSTKGTRFYVEESGLLRGMKIESRSRLLLNRKRIGRRTPIAHTAGGSNLTWRKKKAWT